MHVMDRGLTGGSLLHSRVWLLVTLRKIRMSLGRACLGQSGARRNFWGFPILSWLSCSTF